MRIIANKSRLSGSVEIPGSKSHTIRAVAIASLACGESVVRKPLGANDTLASRSAYRELGAHITGTGDWTIRGVGGKPCVPGNVIDVANSGTTLYIALGSACLLDGCSVFTGDEQIRRRPVGPLIDALNALGASVESTRGNGMAPLVVRGPMSGGNIRLDCGKTSQYLTSLLINCPLASGDTTIDVENLVEKPYIEMTLRWIESQGIRIENDGFTRFHISGGQSYRPFDKAVPADWSSAAFFLCAAAVTGSEITLVGLDPEDSQGDKSILDVLSSMGADIEHSSDGIRIAGRGLTGGEFDLSDTPDALPALAVTACFAEGETRLVNVAQARLKETDRISVMCEELSKMGADIRELPDGLVIRGGGLKLATVLGHDDHRVIMALAVAGLAMDGETIVEGAQAVDVTFPTFVELMNQIGAGISTLA